MPAWLSKTIAVVAPLFETVAVGTAALIISELVQDQSSIFLRSSAHSQLNSSTVPPCRNWQCFYLYNSIMSLLSDRLATLYLCVLFRTHFIIFFFSIWTGCNFLNLKVLVTFCLIMLSHPQFISLFLCFT